MLIKRKPKEQKVLTRVNSFETKFLKMLIFFVLSLIFCVEGQLFEQIRKKEKKEKRSLKGEEKREKPGGAFLSIKDVEYLLVKTSSSSSDVESSTTDTGTSAVKSNVTYGAGKNP